MSSKLSRTALVAFAVAAALSLRPGPSFGAPNQFVIISDVQALGNDQGLEKMIREVVALRPAFVVSLGDRCSAMDGFRRMREAGIEVHVALGNHDGDARWTMLSERPPFPYNKEIDTHMRFGVDRKFYYSFNRA